MMRWIHELKLRLWVRPCHGCDDHSFHTAHLTWLGHRRYTR